MKDRVSSQYLELKERIKFLESLLLEISTSKYCSYSETSPDLYGIGVTDGHRYCAEIAKKAWEDK
jgi:hypothetical protein